MSNVCCIAAKQLVPMQKIQKISLKLRFWLKVVQYGDLCWNMCNTLLFVEAFRKKWPRPHLTKFQRVDCLQCWQFGFSEAKFVVFGLLNSFGFFNFWNMGKLNLSFLTFFDQFNFYVGLAGLKIILADFWTLFLDREWSYFFGSFAVQFYNF